MKGIKLVIVLLMMAALLVGCTRTPIAPDGEVTPNNELETMVNF